MTSRPVIRSSPQPPSQDPEDELRFWVSSEQLRLARISDTANNRWCRRVQNLARDRALAQRVLNERDEDGATALGRAIQEGSDANMPNPYSPFHVVVKTLVEAGANPLRGDRIFIQQLHARWGVDEDIQLQRWLALLMGTCEEAGHPFRDEYDNNALHVWADQHPASLLRILEDHVMIDLMIPVQWCAQPNRAGDTPLHRLWRTEGLAGHCLCRLIMDRVQEGMPIFHPLLFARIAQLAQAEEQAQALDASTGPAPRLDAPARSRL